MDSARLPDVFDGFYEAAFEPERWRAALEKAALAIDSAGVSMMPSPGLRLPTVHPAILDEMAEEYFQTDWFRHNDRFAGYYALTMRGAGVGRAKVLTNDSIFIQDPKMTHLAIQEDFFRRHGLRWFASAAPLAKTVNGGVFLSVDRFERQGPFSKSEVGAIDLIAQHLRRAARVMLSLDEAGCKQAAQALGMTGKAAIYLGRDMQVVALNGPAEALLGCGLRVANGRLAATHPASHEALLRVFRQTASADFTASRRLPGPVILARPTGRPLVAHVAPIRSTVSQLLRNARVLVLVTDPDEAHPAPEAALLRDLFGLSPAEARLASALAAGASLDACARTFGVRYATVRNQLASVFDKVGVKRQSELVALIVKLSSSLNNRA